MEISTDDSLSLIQVDEMLIADLLPKSLRNGFLPEFLRVIQKSAPLIFTFLLQNSLSAVGLLTISRLGSKELGGANLGLVTATATGFLVYEGLSSCLDNVCSEAFGARQKRLVGLQTQRMFLILCVVTVPIMVCWFNAAYVLHLVVADRDVVGFASDYLQVLAFGCPGYVLFECGKRFLQSQGLFTASFYALSLAAPFNCFLCWFLVWYLEFGFIGAPLAMTLTIYILPLSLLVYSYLVAGRDCWFGFEAEALTNWEPLLRTAIPNWLMLESEYLAFEIMTLLASSLGTTELAVQSILELVNTMLFQIPFAIGTVCCTRIATHIGAGRPRSAKTCAVAAVAFGLSSSLSIALVLTLNRSTLLKIFITDKDVAALVSAILPLCTIIQIIDALTGLCNGIIRGLGKQKVGAWVNLSSYYVIGLPVGILLAFGLHWKVTGLWSGIAAALSAILAFEIAYICSTEWGVIARGRSLSV